MWQNKLKSAGANQERLVLALTVLEVAPRRKEKMSMTSQIVLSNWSGSMATMQKDMTYVSFA